jgi:hypothetical protein
VHRGRGNLPIHRHLARGLLELIGQAKLLERQAVSPCARLDVTRCAARALRLSSSRCSWSCHNAQDVTPARSKVVERQIRNQLAPTIGSQPRAAAIRTHSLIVSARVYTALQEATSSADDHVLQATPDSGAFRAVNLPEYH